MLDPDSDSLRDRFAVWLRGTYEDAVEDATGSTPPEGDWLADADGLLLVLLRYQDQAQRTRPQHDRGSLSAQLRERGIWPADRG